MSAAELSVLDLVFYPQGKTIAEAFAASRDLAQHVERLGYKRYWLAEHHNLEGIASSSTAVLIGFIAGSTSRIRVGSGGIMLPNHAPLMVAEQFGTLATLYPDRIDLGLGRAPGTDQLTSRALRRDLGQGGEDFPDLIEELRFFMAPARPGQRVKAIPGAGIDVPIWILGSSLFSAELAASLGLPYAFAGHFAPQMMSEAIALYKARFKPSADLAAPRVMVGVSIVAAETDAEAEHLATTLYQARLNLIRGTLQPLLPPVKSMTGMWSADEEAKVKAMMRHAIIGGPATVQQGLKDLQSRTGADEIIATSDLFAHEKRLRSFEIIIQAGSPS